MIISENTVVLFDFTLTDGGGARIDSSEGDDPVAYLHGTGAIVPGLEVAFEGKSQGDTFQVTVPPADGFGERDEALMEVVPREEFEDSAELEVGMQFRVPTDDGESIVTVMEVSDDEVSLDGNHELAGMTLNFDVVIREVRKATPEEIAHGHAHGVGGHHH